jgi:hypothetical protein
LLKFSELLFLIKIYFLPNVWVLVKTIILSVPKAAHTINNGKGQVAILEQKRN